ncbi:threonine ammonia-lyase [Pelagibius litoralis]|uniref:Threonine ammonia-lyase n=1 Tax=Pelagibius litoralis TaxID=374515 RepID=A0A967C4D5_9PROT|nr:threonine ammonia-lyase [Pelagibius litoralis]NIA67016.1 threonine ammonia-lyase [Pelagibius litoralis]
MTTTLEHIRDAAERLRGQVIRTPLVRAGRLSERLGCELFLKLENLQHTGSFKDRGSYIRLSNLSKDEAQRGVIAMSAGNHAQGVAYHAQRLGIPATIVMPEFAPFSKVERTRAFGARIVLTGDTLDASAQAAYQIAEDENLTFVHPFDDSDVIAGQGTVGLEILEDSPDIEAIVVPIGGGGLMSAIATVAKDANPAIQLIGVESELFPSMSDSIKGRNTMKGGHSLADGIAVKVPGKLTRPIIEKLVDDIVVVAESDIENAIQRLAEEQKLVAEGAGAAGIAAILANPERFAGRKVAVVICGGNIDLKLLSGILTRGLIRDGRMVRLRIGIIDQPGVLARIASLIGKTGGNIIEVYHQRLFYDVPAKQADVDVVLETRNSEHVKEVVASLQADGFPARILSDHSAQGTL